MYEHVAQIVFGEPWAITAEKFLVIQEAMMRLLAGDRPTEEEIAAIVAARPARRPAAPQSGSSVAVLPLFGTIAHRAGMLGESSGGTSTEAFGADFRALVADPSVSAVVIDVDSPGGTVGGVDELATEIGRAATRKPVVAVANSLAASAAYWLASQASELVSIPSGQVGSIGVMMAHTDASKAMEMRGYRPTIIKSARFKDEGASSAPLTPEAQAHYQEQVDHYHGVFTRAVARGRGVPVSAVRGPQFGEGRVYNAQAAKERGMIDRVATLDQVVSELAGGRWQRPERASVDLDGITAEVEPTGRAPDGLSDQQRRRLRLSAGI